MPYGFYITDKGRELITASTSSESKVEITKACFGSGGSPETEKNYAITSLVNQFYEKQFQPGIDSYKVSDTDPTELCIQTIVPSEVSGTINEIGYKDDSDNLIIYGVVRERKKDTGSEAEGYQLKYENWIKVTNSDVDKIEIKVLSPEVEQLTQEIEGVKTSVTDLESSLDNDYTKSSEFTELSNKVDGFETTFAKDSALQELITRVSALETALEGVDTLMEELI